MKTVRMFFVILFAVYAMSVTAQSYTEKWNSFYKRYDIYDASGNQVGYYKWNSFYERWEFHNL